MSMSGKKTVRITTSQDCIVFRTMGRDNKVKRASKEQQLHKIVHRI